jgi:acetoin utilization deacetylase AcuC-like enzyme/GNAT superfamily N-acetyltransferase
MLIIRRISDCVLPVDKTAIMQVQEILRSRIPDIQEKEIDSIPDHLKDPLKFRFRSTLLVAENRKGLVQGFAMVMYASDLNFCYLDYIASKKDIAVSGIGSSLYESVREFARELGASGLFFECLPDEPGLCSDESKIEQNRNRLKFYERFGAFPMINTLYETPLDPEKDECPPYLVCDLLVPGSSLGKKTAQMIIRAILERKYAGIFPQAYIQDVVASVTDDPVQFRPPRYLKKTSRTHTAPSGIHEKLITLIVNDKHSIHHVRDRGYVESPVRISSILAELQGSGLFREIPVTSFSEEHIREVHDKKYIHYFKRVCENLPAGKSIYPYVFPVRNAARAPVDDSVLAGYYCIDTFTPLNKNAFLAAKRAVDCCMTGSIRLLDGTAVVYALVRPPGHHAEKKVFGGFCYFNSAAIAANFLSRYGKVAMLDLDYHHGNGQQDIFYDRKDVLTISIHGHPSFAYPYFCGFAEEKGEGEGSGFNINYPLKEQLNGDEYYRVLEKAVEKIRRFKPSFLILLLGLDTAKGDPTGTWSLTSKDFYRNGQLAGLLKIPTLVVQEGGYRNRVLGINARHFFQGFHHAINDHQSWLP